MFPEVLGPFWAHAHRVQDRFAVVKGLENSYIESKSIKPMKFAIFSNSPPAGWAGIAAGYRTRRLTTGLKGRSLKDRSKPRHRLEPLRTQKMRVRESARELLFRRRDSPC